MEDLAAKQGLTFARLPGGEFTMGSEAGYPESRPAHRIRLDPFELALLEVTVAQYAEFLKAEPRKQPAQWTNKRFAAATHPVVGVNFEDAVAFCRWVGGRLPTEAEWEFAARGADGRRFPWGNELPDSRRAAYHLDVGFGGTRPAGEAKTGAGPFGNLDLAGNVFEWCSDWYDEGYYRASPMENPLGPASGELRVIRGGSWLSLPDTLDGYARAGFPPTGRSFLIGFRVARSVK